jgi:protein-disulfide isomerase
MGTFSVFLVSLLLNVLHQSCLYCFASASFSWTLAACAWLGGALPEEPQEHKIRGLQASAFSFLVSVGASVTLFASIDTPPAVAESNLPPQSPPAITTSSSTQALVIGKELKRLNAKMYGAFWCSHCYDQKQTLGREAFTESVQYIECSKDGVNTQYQFCRDKVIPGYPTWEINGEFYPGEQDLDELQEIIEKAKVAAASKRQ